MENPKRQKASRQGWENLDEDVLLTIYQKLDIKDLISGAPLCCTSWYDVSKDPSLWREVNLRLLDLPEQVSSKEVVEFVVARSKGSLTCISFPCNASPDDLLLIAERCPDLKHFNLRLSKEKILVGRNTIDMSISKMRNLEGIEVDEFFISDASTVKQITQSCSKFTKLKIHGSLSSNTASLIATFLPKLKSLDVSTIMIHRKDLLLILGSCLDLESLDITGCGKVYGSDEILKIGRTRLKHFKWDHEKNRSCSRCEEEIEDSDLEDFYYRWPCEHVLDDGYLTYIEGTMDLPELVGPVQPVVMEDDYYEYPGYVDFDSDGDDDDDNGGGGNPYECDCCYGYKSPPPRPLTAKEEEKRLWDFYASL